MGDNLNILKKFSEFLPENINKILKKEFNSVKSMVGIRNRVQHYQTFSKNDLEIYRHFCEKYVLGNKHDFISLSNFFQKIKDNPNSAYEKIFNLNQLTIAHNLPSVEYYETGFIGRQSYLKQIDKVVKNKNYPIITIHGEGGVGKTALTLFYVYGLLDNPDGVYFDQIHWESAKTKRLSSNEIINISNEIRDFKEMISSPDININNDSDVIDSVIEYLKNFKILLVLDNIETVRDKFLEEFLEKFSLVETQSKVIFTSRQAFQKFEYDIRVEPFTAGEAQNYFRKLVDYWKVDLFFNSNNAEIDTYTKRWNYNPLFIRSFIECVRDGQDPNLVLESKFNPLNFAFENMYSNLKTNTIPILNALLIKDRKRSASYLSIITEKNHDEVIDALVDLEKKNFLERNLSNTQNIELYRFTNIAREFLSKFHDIPADDQKLYLKKEKEISISLENERNSENTNIYSLENITANNSEEVLVKKLLLKIPPKTKALNIYLNKKIKDDLIIDELKKDILNIFDASIKLNPNFFEIYRLRALYYLTIGDYSRCNESYEYALHLNPKSTSVMFFYSNFLIKHFEDTEQGMKLLETAYHLDPNPEISLSLAKAYTYLKKYEKSDEYICSLVESIDTHKYILRKKITQVFIDNKKRQAEDAALSGDFESYISLTEKIKVEFEIYKDYIDDRSRFTIIDKSIRTLHLIKSKVKNDNNILDRLERIEQWLNENASSRYILKMDLNENKSNLMVGKVIKIFQNGQLFELDQFGNTLTKNTNTKGSFGVIENVDTSHTLTFGNRYIPHEITFNSELINKKFYFKYAEKSPRRDGQPVAFLVEGIEE